MAYIGNQPSLAYTSFSKQDFTTSATDTYTLDFPVANENEIALFLNFVRQEPTTAYTASGTTLTLASAITGSDDMYCVFLGKAVQTVNPPNGSVGLSQLSATGTPSSSTFLRGDNSWQTAGGVNSNLFFVTNSSVQTWSHSTWSKVQFNSEIIDTGSNYDPTTNYRYTAPSNGKYFFYSQIVMHGTAAQFMLGNLSLYVNGSAKARSYWFDGGYGYNDTMPNYLTLILDLSANDYVEMYYIQNNGGYNSTTAAYNSSIGYENIFMGYKMNT